ncbi:MAG: ABC transporter ATP-binding protein [bacterium]|jgi:branched-chain amino acid transport system ATP-binding protein
MSRKILDVKGVNKSFGGLKALNEVVFDAVEGETHAIIGPNGAGKSTFLNVCIGKLVPDTGTVMFDGQMMTGKQPHQINQAGIVRVFQTPEIFQDLTILQNVMISAFSKRDGEYRFNAFTSMLSEKNVQQEAESILEDLNMESMLHNHAKSLSRGDKRRLELAMSLIQKPKLLLLDEPTAGMSRIDTNRTIELLSKIKQKGITKVIIEHDMHVVFSLADRISVLAQGHVIATGLPDEIRKSPKVKEAYLGGESHA